MTGLPAVITHIYDPARGPARNLCDLPPPDAERVLDEIRAAGLRHIKANYLRRRLAIEDWLIAERRRKLGETPLQRPIYFFLGDFSDGRDPSRPCSLVMPLVAFRAGTLTFTYPDSMASLPLATRLEWTTERRPYHGQVFTLAEITAAIARYGLPGETSEGAAGSVHDRFVEVQVWDASPIATFLAEHPVSGVTRPPVLPRS